MHTTQGMAEMAAVVWSRHLRHGPLGQGRTNAVGFALAEKLRVIHVFTHDSIGLGEDGPTHQPVEPSALLLSRQNLPAQTRAPEQVVQVRRGGYVPSDRAGARAALGVDRFGESGPAVGLTVEALVALVGQTT